MGLGARVRVVECVCRAKYACQSSPAHWPALRFRVQHPGVARQRTWRSIRACGETYVRSSPWPAVGTIVPCFGMCVTSAHTESVDSVH